ncbi:hypothetical protein, partial [Psychrobacter faecalis]|uniref:hypothetical protein n=1 Tax=Psychrobacter faecalis TaxID=180588 RepID=UPI0028AEA9F0
IVNSINELQCGLSRTGVNLKLLLYKKTALINKAVFLVSRETLNKYFLDSHFLLITLRQY